MQLTTIRIPGTSVADILAYQLNDWNEMSDQTNTLNETLSKVRALVHQLVEEDVGAKEITFALAYISTEFGLYVTDGAVEVMPTVMSAVSKAVVDMDRSLIKTEASADSIEMPQQSVMTH